MSALLAALGLVSGCRSLAELQRHRNYIDESAYWHSWIDFAPDRVDPQRARQELDDLLSDRGQERLEDEVTEIARHLGVNTTAPGFDWRDHIYLRWEPHVSSPLVTPAPPPPANWMEPDFDPAQADWSRRPEPLQMGRYEGGDDPFTAFMMVRTAYHRADFLLEKPEPMTLDINYRGGVRVFINGREVFRGHLPDGELAHRTPAEGYRSVPHSTAFRWGRGTVNIARNALDRSAGNIEVPAEHLRPGRNVIAVENRAPLVAPSAVEHNRSYGAAGPGGSRRRDFNIAYAHTGINRLRLRPAADDSAPAPMRRPPGVQVWAGDIHQRYHEVDFLEPGAAVGELRVAGARNGSYAAVMLLGADRDLTDLRFEVDDLVSAEGARISAAQVKLKAMLGMETSREVWQKTGGHRGGFSIRGAIDYPEWRYRGFAAPPKIMFDAIGHRPPTELAAGHTQPVWVEVSIPADARPGVYRGRIAVEGQGLERRELPLLAAVADWRLPAPTDFAQDVWIEQSPYGLAHAAGLAKEQWWSEEHWRLVEASLAHLGRIGMDVVHIPVLQRSEFGNIDDAMIRWRGDPATERVELDLAIMERYLDLVARHLGKPRVVAVNIMQGGGVDRRLGGGKHTMDEYNTLAWLDREEVVDITEHPHLYRILAGRVLDSFRERGWLDSLHWGFYWDHPPQEPLLDQMAEYAPEVYWIRGGHIAGGIHPRVRAQSELFPSWEDRPEGAMHVVNPRRHCPVHTLEGPSLPFSYRVLPVRALAAGYTGFGRMGADYLGYWGEGNDIRGGVPDFGVKSMLWQEADTVMSSQRFEVLREAVQEAEAYLHVRRAVESGTLPADLERQARDMLRRQVGEPAWVPAYFYMLDSGKLHDHDQGWQRRSWQMYRMAAETARTAALSH